MRIPSFKIGVRLGAALTAVALLTTIALVVVQQRSEEKIIAGAELRELRAYQRQLTNALEAEAGRALALADQVAMIPDVQAAFAAGDRERLAALFAPGFKAMKQEHNVRQFQFHLPRS